MLALQQQQQAFRVDFSLVARSLPVSFKMVRNLLPKLKFVYPSHNSRLHDTKDVFKICYKLYHPYDLTYYLRNAAILAVKKPGLESDRTKILRKS
jgi:hypothetical protein